MTLEYSNGKVYKPVGDWLLNYIALPGRLTVHLDLLTLRTARKEVSIATALWRLRGIEYQSVRSENHEDIQRMTVYATVVQTDAERLTAALAAVDARVDQWHGRVT